MKVFHQVFLSVVLTLSSLGLVAQEAVDGQTYFNQGQFEKAAEYWEKVLSTVSDFLSPEKDIKSCKDTKKCIDTSVRLAAAYQKLGRVKDAHKLLETVLPFAKNGGDPVRHANVLMQLSDVYLAMRDFQEKDMDCDMKKEMRPERLTQQGVMGKVEIETKPLTQQEIMDKVWYYLEQAEKILKPPAVPRKMGPLSFEAVRQKNMLMANLLNKKGNMWIARSEMFNYREGETEGVESLRKAREKAESLEKARAAYQRSASLSKSDKVLNIKSMLNALDTLRISATNEETQVVNPSDNYKLELHKAWQQVQELPDKLHEKVFFLIKIANLAKLTPPLRLSVSSNEQLSCPLPLPLNQKEEQIRLLALHKALELAKQKHDKRTMIYVKSNLALLYADKHCYSEAVHLTKKALNHVQYPITCSQSEIKNGGNRCIEIKDGGDSFISGRFRNQSEQFVSTRFKVYLPSLLDKIPERECRERCLCQDISFSKNEVSNLSIIERIEREKECNESFEGKPRKADKKHFLENCKGNCQLLPPLALQNYHPELLLRLERQLGILLEKNGQRQDAITAYERALEHLRVRQESRTVSRSFSKMAEQVPFELADLQLRFVREIPEKDKQALLEAAVNTIEIFKGLEIQNYFGDMCITKIEKYKTVTEVKQFLPSYPKTVIFYPLLFEDRFELLLISKDGQIKHETNPHERSEGIKQVENNIDTLHHRLSSVNCGENKHKMYKWFEPILKQIDEKITIVIVPHGKLYAIPFAALYDKEHDQLLIEKHPLVITPSIKLTDARQQKTTLQHNDHVLVTGLSVEVGGFHKLCDSPSEVMNVSCILGGNPEAVEKQDFKDCLSERKKDCKDGGETGGNSTEANIELFQCLEKAGIKCPSNGKLDILQDQDFTFENVKNKLGEQKIPYSIVHFGTHGQFSKEPSKTHLVTYMKDENITMEKLRELIKANQNFGSQPGDLLTLSACETAQGDERAALGLASTAINAGVPNALATLWPVLEDATADLMKLFYRNLKSGTCPENSDLKCTKAQALQNAQKQLLMSTDKCGSRKKYDTPHAWAPFLLIGNGL